MDMSMGMSGGGLFKDGNMAIARAFWFMITSIILFLGLRRCLDYNRARWRYAC